MAYIPHGCDSQGRHTTGIWTAPHRTHEDFVDTYPTAPGPLDAAHAATEIQGDDEGSGIVRGVAYGLIAWACVALCAVIVVLGAA